MIIYREDTGHERGGRILRETHNDGVDREREREKQRAERERDR